MNCSARRNPIFNRGTPGGWRLIVLVCSAFLLIEQPAFSGDFSEPFAIDWFPLEPVRDAISAGSTSHDIGAGPWIADTFAHATVGTDLHNLPPLPSFALLALHDVFRQDPVNRVDGFPAMSLTWPGEPAASDRATSYAHRAPTRLASARATHRNQPAQSGTRREFSHPRLGQSYRSSLETRPLSTMFSTGLGNGLPHELEPPGWEWSRSQGSLPLGERLELIGQTVDLRASLWTNDPQFAQDLELRGDAILPRVGLQYEILPNQIIGYYAYEQAAIGHHGDDLLPGTHDFVPFLGESHRAGVQTRSSDGRWELVASGFYSEMDLSDALFASPRFSRSVGAILAVNARVTRRWNTTFRVSGIESYGLSTDEEEGWRIPRKESNSSLSIWNRIRIWEDGDQNLTLGLGTRLVSTYKNGYADSMILPGYSRWDAGLFYRRRGLDARFYVESILDAGYYEGTDHLLNNPDSPLSIEAKVQLRY